jgi:hypothetical protein
MDPKVLESMPPTIRARIVTVIEDKLKRMRPEDGHCTKWYGVLNEPIDPDRSGQLNGDTISVLDRDEETTYEAGTVVNKLRIQMEYWLRTSPSFKPSKMLEIARGDIVRLMLREQQLKESPEKAPLTMGIHLVHSDKDVEGPRAQFVSGLVEFDVVYRHHKLDPCKLPSEALAAN